jgi:multisubunit Na+/H+ antiporter MnhB subunit
MKIQVAGAVLTGIFFIVVAYLLSNMNLGIPNIAVAGIPRLVDVFGTGIYAINSAISQMLWHYRGIDIVVQAMFLFAAALATSVLFHEPTGKGESE